MGSDAKLLFAVYSHWIHRTEISSDLVDGFKRISDFDKEEMLQRICTNSLNGCFYVEKELGVFLDLGLNDLMGGREHLNLL